MPIVKQKIAPCLWFDGQAEEAATFYVSVFKNSKINEINYYGKAGHEAHGQPAGSVMTVAFELDGQSFVAFNAGPHFKFSEAISFQVYCDTQDEIDYYWDALSKGGQEAPCGWLKDKFGLSWQVVPVALLDMMLDRDTEKSGRVMTAFLQMKKFDLAALKQAFAGQA